MAQTYLPAGANPHPHTTRQEQRMEHPEAHVLAILTVLLEHARSLHQHHLDRVAHARAARTTCDACGCLCWPWEHCPGCVARRLERKAAA